MLLSFIFSLSVFFVLLQMFSCMFLFLALIAVVFVFLSMQRCKGIACTIWQWAGAKRLSFMYNVINILDNKLRGVYCCNVISRYTPISWRLRPVHVRLYNAVYLMIMILQKRCTANFPHNIGN